MTLTKQIDARFAAIFPHLDFKSYLELIKEIQMKLCPTCPENKNFNPFVPFDCRKRSKYVSAEDILAGRAGFEVIEHWVGKLVDAKGAMKLLVKRDLTPERPYYCKANRWLFGKACGKAQMEIAKGETWKSLQKRRESGEAVELPIIGMAFKLAHPEDPTYLEICELGIEE